MDSRPELGGYFDWYGATVPRDDAPAPQEIIAVVRSALSKVVTVEKIESGSGLQGWDTDDRLVDFFGQWICSLLHRGHNAVYGTHIVASGSYTRYVAEVIREWWPSHLVSRADVAIDLDGPGCWDKVYGVLLDVARQHVLSWKTVGDFREDRDELAGRTAYVGSRHSPVLVRGYEKGKQLIASRRVGEAPISLDHCRVEVEVKPPNKAAKLRAAKLSPREFWGCSAGSRDILARMMGLDVERICMTARKESDARRAIRHMAVQYRAAMETVIAEENGEAGLLGLIREAWADMDAERRAG